MSVKKEILVVGSIAFDSIDTPNGGRDKILGGSATYFSVAAALYTKVSVVGVVGNDFTKSDWAVFNKSNINIDSIELVDGKTFSWGGKYNDDYSERETLFTELGVFENFKPFIKNPPLNPILYLGNIQPDLQFDVINKVKDSYLIAADSMNLWIDLFPEKVWKLISNVNILMLNDEEAMQISKKNDLNEIADTFLELGPQIVIIKRGSKGSLLAYKNNKINISVVPNTKLIDPTGAGDSFAGGVLGYIAINGIEDPVQSVLHGTAVASYTVSGFGLEKLCTIKNSNIDAIINKIEIS